MNLISLIGWNYSIPTGANISTNAITALEFITGQVVYNLAYNQINLQTAQTPVRPYQLFIHGTTFDSFLAGLGRNWVFRVFGGFCLPKYDLPK